MKAKKTIKALLMTSLVLFTSIIIVSADYTHIASDDSTYMVSDTASDGYFTEDAQMLEIKAWSETKDTGESFSLTGLKSHDYKKMSEAKRALGENFILHNNGKPIETNILLEKDGNELYAVTVNNLDGVEQTSYYFAQNADDYEMDDLLREIDEGELENSKTIRKHRSNNRINSNGSNYFFDNYKFDYFAVSDNDGKKRQQGSQTTSYVFTRTPATHIGSGQKGSIWDVFTDSQMLSRSNGVLLDHKTRLDAGYTNQALHSWGPKDSGGSTAKVSLGGLIAINDWEFELNGFSVDDLSVKSSKYGRWHFKPRVFKPTRMNTQPGIRATNTKGRFGVKMSQTARISTPYANSNHSTGVVNVFAPDL